MPGPGKPFRKGETRAPGPGRPKIVEEFRDRCRKFVSETVLACWEREVESGGEDWMRASELLANYGFGKPAQAVEHTGAGGSPISITFVRKGAK